MSELEPNLTVWLLCLCLLYSRVAGEYPYSWACNTTSSTCTRLIKASEESFTPHTKCKLECVSTSEEDKGFFSTRVLWPRPKHISGNSGKTAVVDVTDLAYEGNTNDIAADELDRLVEKFKSKYNASQTGDAVELILSFDVKNGTLVDFTDTSDESYELSITNSTSEEGEVSISALVKASTYFGARHGLETLSQLALTDPVDGKTYMVTGIEIEDSPYYFWRGLSVDTSRNFISPPVIKKLLDGLAAAKMNTLHWHLTDSHSFPYVSSSVPQMSQYGAYLPGKTYTSDDVAEIVLYAKKLGIRVVPELDAPAHAGYGWQWGQSAGELVVCLGKEPWTEYCLEPPCGQMNVVNAELYPILKKLYTDLKDSFPSDWFHMGGDEVNFNCWKSVKTITDFMETKGWKTEDEGFMKLWDYYQTEAYKKLAEARAEETPKAILWSSRMTEGDDLSLLSKEKYAIQFWGTTVGSDAEAKKHKKQLKEMLEKGYSVIMSNHNELYLDCGFGAWVGAGPNNWCSPFKSWHQIYMSDIRQWIEEEEVQITEAKAKEQVLGGETAIWTEQTSDSDIIYKVFPRTWAYAERLWSNPSKGKSGELGSWEEAEERLSHFASLMKEKGRGTVLSNTMKPEYCLQNDGTCVLESKSSCTKTLVHPGLVVVVLVLQYLSASFS
ncbi:hypothetical protein ACHWQZ_G017760 [Mnemiopsis leidyi]